MRLPSQALLLVSLVATEGVCSIASCAAGCQLALSHQVFEDVSPREGYYNAQCGSTLRVKSLYICAREYCSSSEIEAGFPKLNQTCLKYAKLPLPPFDIINNITDREARSLHSLKLEEYRKGPVFREPVWVSKSLFTKASKSTSAWEHSEDAQVQYAHVMIYFWAFVVLIGLLKRFNHLLDRSPMLEVSPAEAKARSKAKHKDSRWLKQHITLPATFSHNVAEPWGWWTIPSRMQSLLLLVWIVINVVLSVVDFDIFDGNLYWPTRSRQWLRYVGDRTGVLATANLPLLWLFATRNNIVLWMTGWSFETAMNFHKWIARMSILQAIVHSIAYTIMAVSIRGWQHYRELWSQRYWTCGAIATVAMALLWPMSLYPIRRFSYEVFLSFHIIAAVATLVGMWFHVDIFHGAYNGYLIPCVAIWVLDRLARVFRLVRLNILSRGSRVSYLPGADTVWVQVDLPSKMHIKPGSYYYLYALDGWQSYESHPFTLSSWSTVDDNRTGWRLFEEKENKPNTSLTFIMRPFDGFTKRIRDLAPEESGSPLSRSHKGPRVLVEGPYGSKHDLTKYDQLLFIVGGTGAAIALAYLTDVLDSFHEARARGETSSYKYRATTIRVVWSVKSLVMFEEVYNRVIAPKLPPLQPESRMEDQLTLNLSIDVHVTGRSSSTSAPTEQHIHNEVPRLSSSAEGLQFSCPSVKLNSDPNPVLDPSFGSESSSRSCPTERTPLLSLTVPTTISTMSTPIPMSMSKSMTIPSITVIKGSLAESPLALSSKSSISSLASTSSSVATPTSPIPAYDDNERPERLVPEVFPPAPEELISPVLVTIRIHQGRPDVEVAVFEAALNFSSTFSFSPTSRHSSLALTLSRSRSASHASRRSRVHSRKYSREQQALKAALGDLAVVACGPPRMSDDTRAAVVQALAAGHGHVNFYSESYSW